MMSDKILDKSTQFLTFILAEELFAVDVMQVREILEFTSVTKVPQTPEFMCGVINLRGSVVPVVDLRMKFGLGQTQKTVNTCVIVLEIDLDGEPFVIGALTDSVQEVIDLTPDQVEPAPKMGTRLNTDFIRGIGKKEDTLIFILSIEKVFAFEELEAMVAEKQASPVSE